MSFNTSLLNFICVDALSSAFLDASKRSFVLKVSFYLQGKPFIPTTDGSLVYPHLCFLDNEDVTQILHIPNSHISTTSTFYFRV